MINRRGIPLGLSGALAAPAIVHAWNLMPIKALAKTLMEVLWGEIYQYEHFEVSLRHGLYSDFPGAKISV